MEVIPWFLIRRTCHYIQALISQNLKDFAIEYYHSELEIKYDYQTTNLELFLNRYYAQQEVMKNESVPYLSGLYFYIVYINCPKHKLFSQEDWVKFDEVMRNFSETVTLSCGVLQTSIRFEKIPFLAKFFRSIDKIAGGMCHDDTNTTTSWQQYVSADEALEVMNTPVLKDVHRLFSTTDFDCGDIVPLLQRVEELHLSQQSTPPAEMWANIQILLKKISLGNFDGQKKIVDIYYNTAADLHFFNNAWKPIPEIYSLPVKDIWDYQTIREDHQNMFMGDRQTLFFIETPGCIAACLIEVSLERLDRNEVTFHMNLEPEFDPEQVSSLLDELIPWRFDRSELLKSIGNEDWVGFEKTLTRMKIEDRESRN